MDFQNYKNNQINITKKYLDKKQKELIDIEQVSY